MYITLIIMLHRIYHRDGSLWAKGKMIGKHAEGLWTWWRKDGTKMRSGYFTKGKQRGKWTTYDRDGRVVKVTLFEA